MTALDGKVVLLTGATDGMGRALAADLAREGATVLVHGRDRARIAATVAEVAKAGRPGRVRSYQADLASRGRGARGAGG
jgi:NAD(P)-dependent dehydrogenase (short-subunit alcohol dehydrogenase family)